MCCGKEVGLTLPLPLLAVVVVSVEHARVELAVDLEGAGRVLTHELSIDFTVFVHQDPERVRLVVVANATTAATEILAARLSSCQRRLQDDLGLETTVGVGKWYREISQVARSYLEAAAAADLRLIRGSNRVIVFADSATPAHEESQYPSLQMEALEMAVMNGRVEVIAEVAERICVKYEAAPTVPPEGKGALTSPSGAASYSLDMGM